MTTTPEDRRRIDTKLADWIARLGSEAKEASDTNFQTWLAEHPAHRLAYRHFQTARRIADKTTLKTPQLYPAASARVHQRRRRWRLTVAMAASFLLAFGLLSLFHATDQNVAGGVRTVEAGREIEFSDLGDGDVMVLDAGASAKLGEHPGVVTLQTGRARFSTASASPPFVVAAEDLRLTARNAVFDVDINGGVTRVFVLDGYVMAGRPGRPSIRLTAMHRLTRTVSQEIVMSGARTEGGWTASMLPLDDMTLGQLVEIVSSRGGPRLILGEPGIADMPLQGQLRAVDIGALARQLAAALDLVVEVRGSDYVLRRRP